MKKIDFDFIRKEIIGRDYTFQTPYGKRLLTYADYTASGRTLEFIARRGINKDGELIKELIRSKKVQVTVATSEYTYSVGPIEIDAVVTTF